MPRRNSPNREMAYHFLVRRYGKSVDWHCTLREIAEVTKVPLNRVRTICSRMGYPIARDHDMPMPYMPVDKFIGLPDSCVRNFY